MHSGEQQRSLGCPLQGKCDWEVIFTVSQAAAGTVMLESIFT